jgi:hypothetical protein
MVEGHTARITALENKTKNWIQPTFPHTTPTIRSFLWSSYSLTRST